MTSHSPLCPVLELPTNCLENALKRSYIARTRTMEIMNGSAIWSTYATAPVRVANEPSCMNSAVKRLAVIRMRARIMSDQARKRPVILVSLYAKKTAIS